MKKEVYGFNIIVDRGINAQNDFAIGPNNDNTDISIRIGNVEVTGSQLALIGKKASTTTPGIVKQLAPVADSTATTLSELLHDYNALLALLRNAGYISDDTVIDSDITAFINGRFIEIGYFDDIGAAHGITY